MNFTCESCQRRFAISDEKVRGKAARVRCKGCGNMITVGPLPEQPSDEERTRMVAVDDLERLRAKASEPQKNPWEEEPTRAAPSSSEASWFAMVHGKQEGPFDLGALSEKIAAGEISGRTYLWKKGLPDWKRAADVPELAGLLPSAPRSPGLVERPAPKRRESRADPEAPTPAEGSRPAGNAEPPVGVARPAGQTPQRLSTQELDAASLFSGLELSKVVRMPQPDLSDIAKHPELAAAAGEPDAGGEAFPEELGAAPPDGSGSTPAIGATGSRVLSPMRQAPRSRRPVFLAAAALLLAGALGAAVVLCGGAGAVTSKFGGGARPAKRSPPVAAADPKPSAAPEPVAAAAEAKAPAAAAPSPAAAKPAAEDDESDAPRLVRGGKRLRPADLERAAAASRPWFRACLDQERKSKPNYSAGRVVVRWTLASSGAVKAVGFDRRDVEDAPIGECMKEKARLLRAAAPGEETVLEIPVNLGAAM